MKTGNLNFLEASGPLQACNGTALPYLTLFALEYAIRMFQVHQDGLKLNGIYKLVIYADDEDVNILGGSVHTKKKNTEALVVSSKKTGLEVNADKNKYMVMSVDYNAGRSHNIKTDNNFSERVEKFKCLGTNLKNQNFIREEIKSRLK